MYGRLLFYTVITAVINSTDTKSPVVAFSISYLNYDYAKYTFLDFSAFCVENYTVQRFGR